MNENMRKAFPLTASLLYLFSSSAWSGAQTKTSPAGAENKVITEADCTAAKLGSTIPVSAIGEPVSGVTLNAPVWTGAAGSNPAYCSVKGAMAPVDANAKPINFQVVFPASWGRRASQMGGGGMNGSIPIYWAERIWARGHRWFNSDLPPTAAIPDTRWLSDIRTRYGRRSGCSAARRHDAGRTAACRIR